MTDSKQIKIDSKWHPEQNPIEDLINAEKIRKAGLKRKPDVIVLSKYEALNFFKFNFKWRRFFMLNYWKIKLS